MSAKTCGETIEIAENWLQRFRMEGGAKNWAPPDLCLPRCVFRGKHMSGGGAKKTPKVTALEPETGTVGTLFPATRSRTGIVRAILQEPRTQTTVPLSSRSR